MSKIIKFPKEPRSEIEKMIRQSLAEGAANRFAAASIDAITKSVVTAYEQWECEVQVSYVVPQHLASEIDEIDRIVESAAHQVVLAVKGKALLERVRFELELAVA